MITHAGDCLTAAQKQKRRGKNGKSAWRAHETVLILKNRWRRPLCPTGGRSPTWPGLTSSGRPHRFAGWCRGFEVRDTIDIDLGANFETETTPEINKLLVSFDSEIRLEFDIEIMRISESGH
jgi:hypothetical protein